MKKSTLLLVASTLLVTFFYACTTGSSSNSELVGNWKMSAIHIVQYDEQMSQIQSQIQSLNDSIAAAKDTASQNKFQSSLAMYQHYLADMVSRKDSSLKNTYWNFKAGNKFEGQESANKKYNGYWEYNEKTKTLLRYLPSDSVKVEVKGDTLKLNLDSTNNIIFVKSK